MVISCLPNSKQYRSLWSPCTLEEPSLHYYFGVVLCRRGNLAIPDFTKTFLAVSYLNIFVIFFF